MGTAREGERGGAGRGHRVSVRAAVTVLVLSVLVALGVLARAMFSDVGQRVDSAPATVVHTPEGAGPPSRRAVAGAGRSSAGSGVGVGDRGAVVTGPLFGSAPADPAAVVVDVVGRVVHPGLARLTAGARVADAIAAVGGLAPGAAVTRVNLARRLVDGEQLVVPGLHDPVGAAAPAPVPGSGAGTSAGGAGGADQPVDLNAATVAELDALPGVGPVTAGRIVAWRTAHQRFTRVEELGEVQGIGPKLLEHLRTLVRV